MAKKRPRISDIDFVTNWAKASSVAEAAENLGLTTTSAAARAASLRKKGVGLKRFQRGPKETDVKGLNAVLKKLGAYEELEAPRAKRKVSR